VPDGTRVSALERLRQSPRRSSGPEMVKALQRAAQLAVLGVGRVGVDDIPANRLQVLARTGLGSKASALARPRALLSSARFGHHWPVPPKGR
jgi:hypothetical protein